MSDVTGPSSRLAAAVAAFVLLGVGLAAGILLLTQPGAPLNPTPRFVGIEAVTLLGDGDLIAVGRTRGWTDPGLIARSTDGGRLWLVAAVPVPGMTAVASAGSRLVASRYCLPPMAGGTPFGPAPTSCLFASDDRGVTWRDLDAGTLVDPTFADANYGWAHEQFPNGRSLFETTDGGLSWSGLDTPCPVDKPMLFRAVATGRQSGYLLCFGEATETGQPWSLMRRSASGETATLFEANLSNGEPHQGLHDEFVKGFSLNPAGSGLAWTSHLYKTMDGGRSWTTVDTSDLGSGGFGEGGFVIDAENAYLVWGTPAKSSIIEYRAGVFRTLVTWPWSIVADLLGQPEAGA